MYFNVAFPVWFSQCLSAAMADKAGIISFCLIVDSAIEASCLVLNPCKHLVYRRHTPL